MRNQIGVMLHGSCRIRMNCTQLVVLEAKVIRWLVFGEMWALFSQGALMKLLTNPSSYLGRAVG